MSNIFNLFKRKKESGSSQPESWEDIKPILEPFKRLAWLPVVADEISGPASSKFSGIPALKKGEEWPCCGGCNEPMQLFLQLNSKDLPQDAKNSFGEGFLQVFYCTNLDKRCEVRCEAFFPFSKSTLVRVLDIEPEAIGSIDKSPVRNPFPERKIVGWLSKEDYPNWEELESLGVTLSDEQSDLLCDLDYPLPNDKLLGWPHWVQGIEYPNCPECGKPMRLIFQIDSEDNLPFMFGDVGCSHITQCEDHRDKVTIAWACG
jgi:hypothetical protein